jgi:hypothetical protein
MTDVDVEKFKRIKKYPDYPDIDQNQEEMPATSTSTSMSISMCKGLIEEARKQILDALDEARDKKDFSDGRSGDFYKGAVKAYTDCLGILAYKLDRIESESESSVA